MKLNKGGGQRKLAYYKMILDLRQKGKTITEIAKQFGVKKQNISYYLCKYGDIDRAGDN